MFGMIDFLMSPEEKRARAKQRKATRERRLGECVSWSPTMKWEEELNIQAATYNSIELFPGVRVSKHYQIDDKHLEPDQRVDSSDGAWRYVVREIPRGERLSTVLGSRHGSVLFDGPVRVPALHRRQKFDTSVFDSLPYMSTTPMEIFSLRAGTRRAKGEVILAGLGLGHQLIEVTKRTKKVKKLTVIEINQGLVDWLYPRIEPHLQIPVEVIVGDAYKLIPKMTADVVLLDTFTGYGSNHYERDDLRRACSRSKVGFIWAWGSSDIA